MSAPLGKDEDSLRHAEFITAPLEIVSSQAGWVVSTAMDPERFAELTSHEKALMGQASGRVSAVLMQARAADGTVISQTYEIGRAALAELIIELVGTFLDRSMFKELVAVLPEDWSR